MKAKKEKLPSKKMLADSKIRHEKLIKEVYVNGEGLYGEKGIPANFEENALEIVQEIEVMLKQGKKGLNVSIPAGVPINQPKWITEIETLCNEQGILPEDLVKQWKEMWVFPSKDGIPKNKHGGFDNFGILKKKEENSTTIGLSKWQLELRKKKLGI